MQGFLKIIVDVLKVPSILVGLLSMIGLLLQKKNVSDVIKGTVKTILGFLVLGGGATLIVSSLEPMGKMFEEAFHIQGVVPNNEAIISMAMKDFGVRTALIMAFGMVMNIVIARISRFKYIFLTGHHTLYMACMISIILYVAGFDGALLIIVGSVILGIVMVLFPAMAQPFMKKIVGEDSVAFGHFSTIGYVMSALIGKLVGGKEVKSTEDMNLPKNLSFLRDSSMSISLTMTVIYIILAVLAGREFVESLSGGDNYIIYALVNAVSFAAGVYIVLQGVRLILNEIIPAFTGISEKLVPEAKAALDCPVVFPTAPNAVLLGFIFSFLGGVVGLFILGGMKATLILPGVVPHFFCGATAGVFGNATGGRRGAVIGSFFNGLLLTFLPAVLFPLLTSLGYANTTFSDADFATLGILLGYAAKFLSPKVITVAVAVVLLAVLSTGFMKPKSSKEAE